MLWIRNLLTRETNDIGGVLCSRWLFSILTICYFWGMESFKRLLCGIFNKKQIAYLKLENDESISLQLKDMDYGYGFFKRDGDSNKFFIFQYPIIDATQLYFNMPQIEKHYVTVLTNLRRAKADIWTMF